VHWYGAQEQGRNSRLWFLRMRDRFNRRIRRFGSAQRIRLSRCIRFKTVRFATDSILKIAEAKAEAGDAGGRDAILYRRHNVRDSGFVFRARRGRRKRKI
jgi:hypothetical protein